MLRRTMVSAALAASMLAPGAATAADTGLDRFYEQVLDWKPCGTAGLDEEGAQCADVTVPLDYADPQGRTITVLISRLAATDPARRRGIMLSNPGGPGGPGLDIQLIFRPNYTPEVLARYDLIGMDPRGVGRSSPITCHWPGAGLRSAGFDAADYAESVATQADLAQRCRDSTGAALPYFNTRNTARDMDVIRAALGEERISYLGASYGTYLGAVFTQMFPERSDRMVFDSAVDPRRYGVTMLRDMGPANEAALDAWADWTAERDSEYRLGADRGRVRAAVTTLIDRAHRQPIRVGAHQVEDETLPALLFGLVSNPKTYGELAGQLRQLTDAADGLPVQPSPELDEALGSPPDDTQTWAIMCNDAPAPRDPLEYWNAVQASRPTQPVFGPFLHNIGPCAFWADPVEAPTDVHNSAPALILQATGDPRTVYESGVGLHRALTGSRLITVPDQRIHGVFGPVPCATVAANAYLADGVLPERDLTCETD
ncbi:alpha/beta fold hydrolase [Nocardia brasiliensis]|uniref:alpha/beta fold hydrolase n=1 Tax=Nocardia brasiliensis TaxID=37326 RepID=UPI002456286A|nr:alpha/beta fold hydrolase [Nocardia brasiliensis]